jgi:L,D-transpeptidase catalytic domain
MRRQPTGRGASRVTAGTRPRYARITAASAALLITLVSVLGGLGVLPGERATARPVDAPGASRPTVSEPVPEPTGGAIALADGGVSPSTTTGRSLPAASGSGRRIVFDISAQRVWLVGQRAGRDAVRRTYLVSGSVTDNLHPGTYSVYSRSMRAWGVDDSGMMHFMVRFAHGARAAIGFHDIPVSHGALVQTRAQLGTPQSHGCIRQWRPDARALWGFAPVGTKVVVVA